MASDPKSPSSEREQTDESLRVEREKADHALESQVRAIEDTADAVIERARARADEVLAAARAKTDRPSMAPASAQAVASDRVLADRTLRKERATADEELRAERAEHQDLLANDREETDRDLLSERARSDDAVATRDEFLWVVSHDLRNMLNAMVGFAAVIEERVSDGGHVDDVRAYAQRIQRSGARMSRLIGDLVDVACIEAGMLAVTRELVDPALVVMEAVDTLQPQAAAAGLTLVSDIVPSSSPASVDPSRILQVLVNLVSNAIKFTPANGRVEVRLERTADELRFTVRDTGVGIPADKLEVIFDRFLQITRNDRRGVGLGLYISKCIVQGHGGQIWAESRLGEGSTFTFTLPAMRRSSPPPAH